MSIFRTHPAGPPKGHGYTAIVELVGMVDTNSRNTISMMPRVEQRKIPRPAA